jgi:anti-anti-sigma factor
MQTSEGTEFVISVQADWACAWIKPEGALDELTAPMLSQALDEALDRGVRKVHVWLNAVPYMDASAIGLLAQADEKARSRRSKIVLHAPLPGVREILQHTPGSATLIVK